VDLEPVAYTPVSAAANLRRSAILGAVIGALAIAVTSLMGHPLMGVFGFLGLGLGAYNNRLLQKSVLRYARDELMNKKRFRRGVAGRLATVTAVAVICAVLVRPDGLAAFVGLAVFHVIMLIGAAVPVFRSLRPTS
jgi:hypothetical protein